MSTLLPFASERGFSIASAVHGTSDFETFTLVGEHPGLTAADITTNGAYTLWTGPTPQYPWLAAPANLEVVSTAAADTFGGTGANIARVRVLNASGVESEINVNLAGTTPVAIPGGPWLRVNHMEPIFSGTGQTNAGVITTRVAGGGVVLSHIAAGDGGLAKQLVYTVPAGFWFIVDTWLITAFTPNGNAPGGEGTFRVDVRVRFGGALTNNWSRLISFGADQRAGTQTIVPRTAPQAWLPMSDIEVRVSACSAPGTLYPALDLNYYLVPQDLTMTYPAHLVY